MRDSSRAAGRREEAARALPREVRRWIREGSWSGPAAGLARGFAQANLVVVPREFAYDLLLFAVRNPGPCPLLEVTSPAVPSPWVWLPVPTCARTCPATVSSATAGWRAK